MKKRYLILILIVLLGIFLRFYRLGDFPVQLNHDEISQLYDAISIAQTGKDIYGNFLPTIFPSINDFKSPFYTYAATLTYLILGDHEWIIRIPGAVFGTLIIAASYLFALKLLGNYRIALLSSFIISVSPSEIFFSRKSFENTVGIFFMLMGFYCLLTYLRKQKGVKVVYLGMMLIATGMYTYFSHAIIIPLLVVVFALIFRKSVTALGKKFFPLVSFWFLLVTPLFLIVLFNPDSRYRSQTVFITQDINLGKSMEFTNKYKAVLDFSFNRYLDQFNPVYVFGNGLELTNQGPLGVGLLFFIQLPYLILGIIYLVRLKDFNQEKKFILAWILIGMLPSGLTFEPHSPHRSIMVFTMFNIISAAGVYYLIKLINSMKTKFCILKRSFFVVLLAAFTLNFTYFIHVYFVNFPFEKSQSIHYPYKQVALFVWSRYSQFDHIIVDPVYGQSAPVGAVAVHYYLAYYGKYPPSDFQKDLKITKEGMSFDKISVRIIDWQKDQFLDNTLMIASPWSIPIDNIDKQKVIERFDFYDGQPAFYAVKL